MKTLKLEDLRRTPFHSKGKDFRVVGSAGTVEWVMGNALSLSEVEEILNRSGSHTVKVTVVPPKRG